MLVKHILHQKGRNVVTVPSRASLSDATRMLTSRRIGALIVLDDEGEVAGVLSERDIINALAEHSVHALAQAVADHMTRQVHSCGENDTVEELMEMMTRRRFRHVPVLDDGHLIGIVSIGDVVKSRIAETELEAESLRSYIATG